MSVRDVPTHVVREEIFVATHRRLSVRGVLVHGESRWVGGEVWVCEACAITHRVRGER
jgi:hypothetical protein